MIIALSFLSLKSIKNNELTSHLIAIGDKMATPVFLLTDYVKNLRVFAD